MPIFVILLYACLYAFFCHTFECVFLSYICMRVCMRVFSYICMRLYACFFNTFVCMFEKNTHTNVLKKYAYKSMNKTQMYEKKQAYKCMKKIHSYTGAVDSQLQRPGSIRVQCLAQGHLSCDKEVNCQPLQLSANQSFF